MKIGIILGSGLSNFTREIGNPRVIYRETGGVHEKSVIEGQLSGKELYVFTGRNHFYESVSSEKILKNVSLAKEYGIKLLIITNSAGGLNKHYKVSDFMLIKSYINFIQKPFVRFSVKTDSTLIDWAYDTALRCSLPVHKGNYLASTGPVYETNSEIKFLRKINADAAGMSTIPEILKASEYGINTLAISCITNILSESGGVSVSHDEVLSAGRTSYGNFSKLLKTLINDY
ncbi:MAG: purine-nucleoside phosphorylase [Ignavibacteria bacterium]|jgi:purine-nucleoside phosphorylase|nr:purine-nucleoside phosphorylase [Ignavibacteria bacterium]